MVGINSALAAPPSVGIAIANLANIAARPSFELQFNALQNRLLDQLVEKIEALNDDSIVNNVDVFLELEKKRLQRVKPFLEDYEAQTVSNYKTALGMSEDLTDLEGMASGGDATAFDSLVAQLNSDLLLVKNVSGLSVGINVKDGLVQIQNDGLGIGDYASYGSDAERLEAVTAAKTKLDIAASVTTINLETVRSITESVLEKIISVTIQIEAVQIADQAEKTQEIKKMQEDHSRLVQVLSLAFEVNQARNESFTQQLLEGPQFQPGTVLDLFS
jgi:hypothetical protein